MGGAAGKSPRFSLMKMNWNTLLAALAIVALCAVCFFAGRRSRRPEVVETVRTDTLTVWDTIVTEKPIYHTERIVEYIHVPVTDTMLQEVHDTTYVTLPRTQREYAEELYEAWVSGYDPALDSIKVYQPTKYVTTVVRAPQKRWHIGPMVGVGLGVADDRVVTTPYVGIGVTYSILSF